MRRFDAVIFDMDGTMVESLLDFGAIRDELGIPRSEGIIETIAEMPGPRRRRAERVLLERELAGARRTRLAPGASATLRAVRAAGLRTALLTRNAEPAMRIILERFDLRFDLAWSRELHSAKPKPDGVLDACARLGVPPGRTVSVGDFRYDVEAARSAGAVSVLLVPGEPPDFADRADYTIRRLPELLELLEITPAEGTRP